MPEENDQDDKFKPWNRKKLEERDLKKLAPQQRSRYLATGGLGKQSRPRSVCSSFEEQSDNGSSLLAILFYEEPTKDVQESQASCQKRLIDKKKKIALDNAPPTDEERSEKDKHEKLIGQLKAAEARNRLRIMRLRYQSSRAQEISHLIACQPTALKAVRLQALIPAYPDIKDKGDALDKLDRERVEGLLEDSEGLLVNRIN